MQNDTPTFFDYTVYHGKNASTIMISDRAAANNGNTGRQEAFGV